MKHLRKIIISILIAAIALNLTIPVQLSAATIQYGVVMGDKNNNYKLYNNVLVMSPANNLMIKAATVCKALGLSYSYNSTTKKLTIKNPVNGKSLVYVMGSKDYTYYSSATAVGSIKTATYKCYYDSATHSYVVHSSTLKYILTYNYYKGMDNYFSKMGYQGLAVYSINGYSSYDIPITQEVINYINARTFTSKDELLDAIRMNLMMHQTGVTFTTNRAVMNALGGGNSLFDKAVGIDKKDTSKDGDYLSLLINSISQSWSCAYTIRTQPNGTKETIQADTDKATLTINVQYETTLAQERIVDSKVAGIIKSLKLTGASDYTKVKKIHDYIINKSSYDTTYQKFSAYNLLVDKTSVCEGYTLTAYRMFLDAGLECRIISGKGNGEAHAWDIVKVNGAWYNIDLTWDDPLTNTRVPMLQYDYFLKNEKAFSDHIRATEFTTPEFLAAYPIAANSYEAQ